MKKFEILKTRLAQAFAGGQHLEDKKPVVWFLPFNGYRNRQSRLACTLGQKSAFSFLEKALRSGLDSPLNRWFNKARNPRIPSFAFAHSSAAWFLPFNGYRNRQSRLACTLGQKSAFSLAEATITLAVLGVIAAISIPSIINKTTDTRRVKLKKAVEVYSNAIVTMSSENNFHGSTDKMDNWGSRDNCANVRSYFKISQDGNTPCQFKTSDGVWWSFGPDDEKGNLSGRLSKALVAFKESDLTKAKAIDEETNDAFFLMTQFDNKQKARILDVAYSNWVGYSANIINNAKVYAFINKKNMIDYYVFCKENSCKSENLECKSCITTSYTENDNKKYYSMVFHDYNGNFTNSRTLCKTYAMNCASGTMKNRDLGDGYSFGTNCDLQGGDCIHYITLNLEGDKKAPDFDNGMLSKFQKTVDVTIWWNCDKNAQSINDCPSQSPETYSTYTIPNDEKDTFMQVYYTTDSTTGKKRLVKILASNFIAGINGPPIPQYNYDNCTGEWDMSKCQCRSYSNDWPCP